MKLERNLKEQLSPLLEFIFEGSHGIPSAPKMGESLPSLEKDVSQPLMRAKFRVSQALGSFSYFILSFILSPTSTLIFQRG